MKLAMVQMRVTEDKKVNLGHARNMIETAAKNGAQLVVLPEMFNCPYSNRYFPVFAEEKGGESWQAMAQAAKTTGVYLVAGSMPQREDGKIYNTSYVFNPEGREIALHQKMHLFDVDVEGIRFFESKTLSPGSGVTVFDTPFGKFGLCICFDIRFPELSRLMALRGARMILAPGAFNMTTGPAHWELAMRSRAVDNQVFVAGIAPAREECAGYVSYANSLVSDPWGTVIYRCGEGEELALVDLDFAQADVIRAQLPLLSARRTDVYQLLPDEKTEE